MLNGFPFAVSGALNGLPPSEQQVQNWLPVSTSQDDFFGVSLMEAFEQNDPWSTLECSPAVAICSPISSMTDTKPLLSETFNTHLTYMSGSDRSSCVSYGSSRTWDTASSQVSFPDLYAEDQIEPDFGQQNLPRNPGRRTKAASRASSRFLANSTIPEEGCSCPCVKHEIPLKAESTKCSIKSNNPANPDSMIPPKTEKAQGKYVCTFCKLAFSRKGDWERHEESKHDPQTYWTCMLGDPAVLKLSGWRCAFCNTSKPNRNEIVEHLNEHKISQCSNKPHANRTWTRKDKLKAHLQQVHSLSETSDHWESWQRPASRKGAWGCGFCGACSFTWEGMLFNLFLYSGAMLPLNRTPISS